MTPSILPQPNLLISTGYTSNDDLLNNNSTLTPVHTLVQSSCHSNKSVLRAGDSDAEEPLQGVRATSRKGRPKRVVVERAVVEHLSTTRDSLVASGSTKCKHGKTTTHHHNRELSALLADSHTPNLVRLRELMTIHVVPFSIAPCLFLILLKNRLI